MTSRQLRDKPQPDHPTQSMPKLVAAGLIGSALEWYDFGLYGASAALVFGPLFFPGASPVAGTLAAFATYAIGFLARPFGGIIFSHYGDKVGRKPVLAATLLVMGLSTVLMGLLPTYGQIGVWAPVLLVLLRLIQGLGAGAEYGGAALFLAEQRPQQRGFYGAFPASGVFVGLVFSLGVFSLVTAPLTQGQFLSWGWRVPYLLSIIVVGVGMYLRMRTSETPEFTKEVQNTQLVAKIPLLDLLRSSPRRVLIAMGANLSLVGYSYVVQTFVLVYVTKFLNLPRNVALVGVIIGAACGVVTMPLFGALGDRIGPRHVIMGGAVFSALFAFPFFWMLNTRNTALTWLAITIGLAVCVSSMFGPIAAFYHDLFETRVRYSGLVFARETTGAIIGGPTPLIATALLAWAGSPWPIAVYMIATVLIPLVAVYAAGPLSTGRTKPPTGTEEMSGLVQSTVRRTV